MAPPRRESGSGLRGTTLLITNLIKLGGLVVAIHEALTAKDAVVMATATFMMAGAQASEGLVLAVIDRILPRSPPEPPEEP